MKSLATQHLAVSVIVGTILFALCPSAKAQQPKKIPRIGYLSATSPQPRDEAFRQGLHDLGYIEEKNIVIDWRFAKGKLDQVPRNAAELVRLKVDIIVTTGPTDTRAAKEATKTIPIIMAQDSDPVGNGFVASFAHPGGNITGLSNLSSELSGKQLELLKEIIPHLSRLAVFGSSKEPGNRQALSEMKLAAQGFKVQLQFMDIRTPKEIEPAFQAASKLRVNALFVLTGAISTFYRTEILNLTTRSQLPAMFPRAEFVEAGGLMSYSVNINEMWWRAATYVDKILKGAKPSDLPVEQPTKFEFVINLKTAKQIGLTIPPNVLARADKVIR